MPTATMNYGPYHPVQKSLLFHPAPLVNHGQLGEIWISGEAKITFIGTHSTSRGGPDSFLEEDCPRDWCKDVRIQVNNTPWYSELSVSFDKPLTARSASPSTCQCEYGVDELGQLTATLRFRNFVNVHISEDVEDLWLKFAADDDTPRLWSSSSAFPSGALRSDAVVRWSNPILHVSFSYPDREPYTSELSSPCSDAIMAFS